MRQADKKVTERYEKLCGTRENRNNREYREKRKKYKCEDKKHRIASRDIRKAQGDHDHIDKKTPHHNAINYLALETWNKMEMIVLPYNSIP